MIMHRRFRKLMGGLCVSGLLSVPALCAEKENAPAVQAPQPRVLAPGVETVVAAQILAAEKRAMPQIYGLDFAFKPLRYILVDVPNEQGRVQRKRIWYLAYRVTNRTGQPRLFVPEFALVCTDTKKHYVDTVIPTAQEAAARREDAARQWKNSATIVDMIPPTPERGQEISEYGIATWEDVDTETDYFSVYVTGLSNGFKLRTDEPGRPALAEDRPPLRKTLKINFWRPGDELFEDEKEIQLRDYEWIYR